MTFFLPNAKLVVVMGRLPGAAAPDLESNSNPMWPSGLADQLIHEKAHPRVTNPLQVVLKAVDRIGVDIQS